MDPDLDPRSRLAAAVLLQQQQLSQHLGSCARFSFTSRQLLLAPGPAAATAAPVPCPLPAVPAVAVAVPAVAVPCSEAAPVTNLDACSDAGEAGARVDEEAGGPAAAAAVELAWRRTEPGGGGGGGACDYLLWDLAKLMEAEARQGFSEHAEVGGWRGCVLLVWVGRGRHVCMLYVPTTPLVSPNSQYLSCSGLPCPACASAAKLMDVATEKDLHQQLVQDLAKLRAVAVGRQPTPATASTSADTEVALPPSQLTWAAKYQPVSADPGGVRGGGGGAGRAHVWGQGGRCSCVGAGREGSMHVCGGREGSMHVCGGREGG